MEDDIEIVPDIVGSVHHTGVVADIRLPNGARSVVSWIHS